MAELTKGAIASINNGTQPQPINLQVLAVRKFPTGDRCRLLVSDGTHSSGFAILASQMNPMVDSGEIKTHAVVNIIRYYCNDVSQKKKMMIILDLKVVTPADEAGGVIGNPKPYEASGSEPVGNASAAPFPARTAHSAGVPRTEPKPGSSKPGEPLAAPHGLPSIRPICSLTPYQSKWTICARVTSKSSIRTWSNSRGEGKLFSMDLLDESGEIRATAFNAECDKFNEIVEVNNVYFISVATLKTANKQYTNLKNDYEMTFNQGTQMVPCHEESNIPTMQFDFVSLDQIEKASKDTIVDLVCVCQFSADMSSVTQKSTGRELKKRDVTIVDSTNRSVNITMWGEQAEKFDGSSNPVLAIKGAKVSDFNGVSLSLVGSSTVQINPDIPEAHQLQGWWESTGSSAANIISLTSGRGPGAAIGANSVYKTFEEATCEGLGSGDAADYYTCHGTVALVNSEKILYMACPGDKCNKKVNDMNNGMYRCEKCNQEYDRFMWRLMISCSLLDYTSNKWVSMFQENGETILGVNAQEFGCLREEDPDQFQKVLAAVAFKEFIFRMRVKMETYNDESRLKTTVTTIAPVNYVEYNRRMIKEIKEMAGST